MAELNLEKDKKLLVATLRKLKSSKDLSSFIDDLLTEEEILDLAQRIKIAKLILEGKTYDKIAEKVKIIKYGKGGLEKVQEKRI